MKPNTILFHALFMFCVLFLSGCDNTANEQYKKMNSFMMYAKVGDDAPKIGDYYEWGWKVKSIFDDGKISKVMIKADGQNGYIYTCDRKTNKIISIWYGRVD